MNKLPVSAFIIAKNEGDRIGRAINSVRDWVDEIIVVDSGSKDNTVEVSQSLGARVTFNEWKGYGPQKVFAEGLCKNDWVLNIDADEEISIGLREEIITQLHNNNEAVAYRIPILPVYNFQEKGHRWTAFHRPVRLYRKSICGFKSDVIHDSVIVPDGEKVMVLGGVINHRSFRSLEHHVEKVNSYSSRQAEHLWGRKRKTRLLVMLFLPFFAFLKSYILRREFVNGKDGILTSHMYAFQRFIRYAKLRELEHRSKSGE